MADIFDYLDWRGDIKFAHSPFCGMDGLVFAELSYLDFTNIVPSAGDESATSVAEGAISVAEAARVYFEKHPEKDAKIGAIVPAKIVELFRRAAASRRFADIGLSRFVDVVDVKAEKQFSALCARIDEKTLFTAYRGTDDTIIGWRENFNMCFKAPVPSQLQAAEYLNDIGAALAPSERLIIGGHSKGGNLAVWAASHC